MSMQTRETMKTTAAVILVALGFGLAVVVLYLLGHLLILIFLAALLASALLDVVAFLERRGLRAAGATGLAYVGLLILLAAGAYLIVSPLVSESSELVDRVPELLSSTRQWIDATFGERLLQNLGQEAQDQIPEPATLVQVPLTVLGVIVDVAIVLVTSFLLLLERKRLRRWFIRLVSLKDRETVLDLIDKGIDKLGSYVRGQLVLMTVVGFGTALGMLIFGVPFALPMGVLAFLLEAVPNFGPLLAGAPVVFLALLESPATALILFVWLLALQALENYVLTPVVQHNAVNLSPLVVFLAVIAGLILFGVVGAIIAVPLVAVASVIVEEILVPMRQRTVHENGREQKGITESTVGEGSVALITAPPPTDSDTSPRNQ